jgi:lipid II:glycine glycyltransferase (peptidoglycan interpeptide bridge formation enzyme)
MRNFSISYDLYDERIIPFLLSNEQASIYHHPLWLKAVAKTFGHTPFYYIISDMSNRIVGLIPFLKIKSVLTGKRIVCLPFSTYCEPLLPKEILKETIGNLLLNFKDTYKIDVRSLTDHSENLKNFSHSTEYVTHILDLAEDTQKTFDSFHPTSVRASIRRAEKNNLICRIDNTESDLKIFYKLETQLRKRLLLPPLPYSFYLNIYNELKNTGLLSLPVIEKDNLPIAAGFILNFKDTYYLEYTASDKNHIGLYPNHKLFWEVIKLAQSQGSRRVDFGRTSIDNTQLIVFKEKWNAKKISIHQFVYPDTGLLKKKQHGLKNKLMKINSLLPLELLKLEGAILYPHLD